MCVAIFLLKVINSHIWYITASVPLFFRLPSILSNNSTKCSAIYPLVTKYFVWPSIVFYTATIKMLVFFYFRFHTCNVMFITICKTYKNYLLKISNKKNFLVIPFRVQMNTFKELGFSELQFYKKKHLIHPKVLNLYPIR